MRIEGIRTHEVHDGQRNLQIVHVTTDEGVDGVGEAGLCGRELAVRGAIDHFRELLIGQDPSRIEHWWQDLYRGTFFRGGVVIGAALSAIDIALWDIQAKALGVPLNRLFGGLVRDRVRCYCHLRGSTADELAADAARRVAEGYQVVRLAVPETAPGVLEQTAAVNRAIEHFEAVRDAVGPEVDVCIDAHTRLTPPSARRLCNEIERFNPYFVEDPLRSDNPASLIDLRAHVSVPLAVGEQFATKWMFREVIERELTDFARIDVCLVGGLTEARKIAGWCETHYIELAPHNPLGPVSTAACLQLDLATPNFGVQELPREPGYLADVFPTQVPFAAGHLTPPDVPGLGVSFDPAAAAAHAFQTWEAPRLRRNDGSVTDW